jgi:glycosyltransferase involved in cell wall biosynthesis
MNRDGPHILHAVTSSLSLILLRGQLDYLKGAGFSPAVLCGSEREEQEIRQQESIPMFTVRMEREVAPFRDLISLIRISLLLWRLRPAICNAGTPKAGLLVGISAWVVRVPCRIYTLRGLRLETVSGLKRKLLILMERIACACAHRVICVSPSLRHRAVHLGLVPQEKTVLLGSGSSNGIDPSSYEPTQQRLEQAAEIRCELGIAAQQHVIGYVGRLTRDKGIPELLSAFALVRQSIPDSVLLLIGTYGEANALPPQARSEIESGAGIIHLDFTLQIAPYYLLMDVFVLPTYREGFPNTVLEAQAAGCPVVTTQATGAVDAVSNGVTGLIVPVGDSLALANAVLELLGNSVRRMEMGMAARERIHCEFRQIVIWDALASLYRDMLRGRGLSVPSIADSNIAVTSNRYE